MEGEISTRQAYAKGLSVLMNLIDKTQNEVADRVGLTQPTISRALDGQASPTTMQTIAEGLGWDPVDLIQIGRGVLASKSDPFDYTGIVRILAGFVPPFMKNGRHPLEMLNAPGREDILKSLGELHADIFQFINSNPSRNTGWVLTELDFLKKKIQKMRWHPKAR